MEDDVSERAATRCAIAEEDAGCPAHSSPRQGQRCRRRNVQKDSGWAWACVFSCFMVNFLVVGGAGKSFGILFVELVNNFDASKGATAWVGALCQCLTLMLGPLANALSIKFTSRRVVIIAGVFLFCGFLLSMLATNLAYLYFSYGIVVGIGAGLAYAPSMVTVGLYFEKRRALANGLSVAGSGVGNFTLPPLMRLLLDNYGLQQTLLILAAIMLNVCVCGALLRPPDMTLIDERDIIFQQSVARQEALPLATCSENDFRVQEIPKFKGARQPGDNRCKLDKKISETRSESSFTNYSDTIMIHSNRTSSNSLNRCDRPLSTSTADMLMASVQAIPQRFNPAALGHRATDADAGKGPCCCLRNSPCGQLFEGTHRQTMTFDHSMLTNRLFLVYAFSVFLTFWGYPNIFLMIPSHVEQIGHSKQDGAFLVSIIGIFDLVGRISFGWFSDLNVLKKKRIFMGSIAISAMAVLFFPILKDFVGLAIFCAVIGMFAGCFIALIAVILAETLGLSKLPSSFGFMVMFMGMSFLIASPIVGFLRDLTGKWNASFYFCGSSMMLGALILLLENRAHKHEINKLFNKDVHKGYIVVDLQ